MVSMVKDGIDAIYSFVIKYGPGGNFIDTWDSFLKATPYGELMPDLITFIDLLFIVSIYAALIRLVGQFVSGLVRIFA